MNTLRNFMEKINTEAEFAGELRYAEPLARHTTFQVGGPADVWVRPRAEVFMDYTAALLRAARSEGIPVFILGGGANLVVSDLGIRGIVLDTGGWSGWDFLPSQEAERGDGSGVFLVCSGAGVDDAAEAAALRNWGGLEFLAGMPGSIGGAAWMNARCYEKSVSDVIIAVEILDESCNRISIPFKAEDYGYKKSPFQQRPEALILSAKFALTRRSGDVIRREMEAHRSDRKNKGHYRFPSAGSAFKNNRDFGKPTGKIIDELGLRGLTVGGAQIAPFHGNIIINTGNARAADIRNLVEEVTVSVKAALGITLEPEILFVGEFPLPTQ